MSTPITETQKAFFGGVALIVIGAGMILFGGATETESYIEFFGFRFGRGESRPMGRGESCFWLIAFIIGGVWLVRSSS